MDLMGLLVFLILIGLVFWVCRTLGGAFGIPAPILAVVYVVITVFGVLYLLQLLGLYAGGPVLRF